MRDSAGDATPLRRRPAVMGFIPVGELSVRPPFDTELPLRTRPPVNWKLTTFAMASVEHKGVSGHNGGRSVRALESQV